MLGFSANQNAGVGVGWGGAQGEICLEDGFPNDIS